MWPQLERLSSWSSSGSLRKSGKQGAEHRRPLEPCCCRVRSQRLQLRRARAQHSAHGYTCDGKKRQLSASPDFWSVARRRGGGKLLGSPSVTANGRRCWFGFCGVFRLWFGFFFPPKRQTGLPRLLVVSGAHPGCENTLRLTQH